MSDEPEIDSISRFNLTVPNADEVKSFYNTLHLNWKQV